MADAGLVRGVEGLLELPSPALVVFAETVRGNVARMLEIAGAPARLRPHVKTHKMPDVVRLLERMGVHKHKCATIAEAEMVASAGGRDVVLAYPLVGPNVARFVELVTRYPETTFRATVDSAEAARALSSANGRSENLRVLVDLDVGMGRTGVNIHAAREVYRLLGQLTGVEPDGLHAYDGHIRDLDVGERAGRAAAVREEVVGLRDALRRDGLPVPRLVLGGTPTFPCHRVLDGDDVELSPGTCTLQDRGYGTKFPDLDFTPAALVLTRVISRPVAGRICVDLGYKAVAADPVGERAYFPDLPDAKMVGHSEEHLVLETERAGELPPGTALLAVPMHVCPTSALYREAYVVEDGRVVGTWPVVARDRVITI